MTAFPTKARILDWISENPVHTSSRDIASAFGIKGAGCIKLQRLLDELQAEGQHGQRHRTCRGTGRLPPVSVLQIGPVDADGVLTAHPLHWRGKGKMPRIHVVTRAADPVLAKGDRILARLTGLPGEGPVCEARLIRRIGAGPDRIFGVFHTLASGGHIVPIDKREDRHWQVPADETGGAREGELIEAEMAGPRGSCMGLPCARIIRRLGDPWAPKALSLIAIHRHGIPYRFSNAALAEADAMVPAGPDGREDLRQIPLITIDPEDARDRDDACHAHADDDPTNPGGHVVWIAIADVAHYIRPGTVLDLEARQRGNATYFPDRVVPMLPDRLSGDLCSLRQGVQRACIAVRLVLDSHGNRIAHRFVRGLMQSVAALSYDEVQAAADGTADGRLAPLVGDAIRALYKAYRAAAKARARRQPLDLELPERRILLGTDGRVQSVRQHTRLEAHRLIEEFMILANVAAAEELGQRRCPLLYRVHEEPPPEKLQVLREAAKACGLAFAKGQVLRTRHLNRLLEQARESEFGELMNMATLRAMTQACYHPRNSGHFGLALKAYAHFTSPIRRYADLIVHRALISAHGWGSDGLLPDDTALLEATAKHISETERRSMIAERDTADRYLATWLSERTGAKFGGRIIGIQRFGAFVRLDETGADGLLPVRALGGEYFRHDRQAQTLKGTTSGLKLAIGQHVTVHLAEAVPATGGVILDLVECDGAPVPRGPPARRKATKAKRKAIRGRG